VSTRHKYSPHNNGGGKNDAILSNMTFSSLLQMLSTKVKVNHSDGESPGRTAVGDDVAKAISFGSDEKSSTDGTAGGSVAT
jgi:hypothetical protein